MAELKIGSKAVGRVAEKGGRMTAGRRKPNPAEIAQLGALWRAITAERSRNITKTEEHPVEPLAIASALGSLAAPVALVLTAMLYVAGYTYRTTFLREFGLSSALNEESLQVTLARGFIPLITGTLVLLTFGAFLWLMYRWLRRAEPEPESSFSLTRISRWYFTATMAFLLLTYSVVAGGAFGMWESRSAINAVHNGCASSCFVYRVRGFNISGRLVLQDKERTAVFARGGLLIFKTDELRLVRRPA